MSKILVIDDQASIRKTLREVLEYENFEIEEAEDGQKGLDLVRKNTFDVILCDIKIFGENFGISQRRSCDYDFRAWKY
jgi:two-component system, NtrC family, nitrogen regulation response regulator NtrX